MSGEGYKAFLDRMILDIKAFPKRNPKRSGGGEERSGGRDVFVVFFWPKDVIFRLFLAVLGEKRFLYSKEWWVCLQWLLLLVFKKKGFERVL